MNVSTLAQKRVIAQPLRAVILALGFAAIALPSSAAVCQNVTFSFTNSHFSGGKIKVKKVKYFDRVSNKTRTENVADRECSLGNTCATDGDDLGSLTQPVQGHDLTDIQFYFSYKEADGDWSDAVWGSKKLPSDEECRNDRNYGAFTITG